MESRQKLYLASPETPSRNKPPKLLARKTTVKLPQNKKKYSGKNKKSPRLECNYAVRINSNTKHINILENFTLYLYCQNNHYEVDLVGKDTFKSIPYSPYSSWS